MDEVRSETDCVQSRPWLDCPTCPIERCGLPAVVTNFHNDGTLLCTACGHLFIGTAPQVEQALKADRAWEEYYQSGMSVKGGVIGGT